LSYIFCLAHVVQAMGGLYIPRHIVDEPNPAASTAAQIAVYLHTGDWM